MSDKDTVDEEVNSEGVPAAVEGEGENAYALIADEMAADDAGTLDDEESEQTVAEEYADAAADVEGESAEETPAADELDTEATKDEETQEQENQESEGESGAEEETSEEPAPETPETEVTQEEQYEAWRTGNLEGLEKAYQLSEDDGASMMTEPEVILPKLAAQIHLNLFESVLNALGNQLPDAVQQVISTTHVADENEKAFFTAWPKLDSEDGREKVYRMAQAYRQANPKATLEDAISEIGASAMVALRIPLEDAADTAAEELPARIPAQSAAVASVPRRSSNEFGNLAEEFAQEDLD